MLALSTQEITKVAAARRQASQAWSFDFPARLPIMGAIRLLNLITQFILRSAVRSAPEPQ
jgi:hypothetical protein